MDSAGEKAITSLLIRLKKVRRCYILQSITTSSMRGYKRGYWVLDKTLEANDIVDTFNSLIWTDRYDEYGDF